MGDVFILLAYKTSIIPSEPEGPNSHKERANFGFYVQKESNFYEVAIMQNVCSDLSCFLLTMRELLQNFTIVSVCYTRTKKALIRFIKSLNLNLLFSKHENG